MNVTMTQDRRGWFWPEPLVAGQELDLPDETAAYLIEVGAAEPAEKPKRGGRSKSKTEETDEEG